MNHVALLKKIGLNAVFGVLVSSAWAGTGSIGSCDPITTVSYTGGQKGTPKGVPMIAPTTSITLTAQGACAPIAGTAYRVDGQSMNSPFQWYSTPFTVPTDGVHRLEFLSVDSAGNWERLHVRPLKVDGKPPYSTLSIGSPQYKIADGVIAIERITTLQPLAADQPLVTPNVVEGVRQDAFALLSDAIDHLTHAQQNLSTDQDRAYYNNVIVPAYYQVADAVNKFIDAYYIYYGDTSRAAPSLPDERVAPVAEVDLQAILRDEIGIRNDAVDILETEGAGFFMENVYPSPLPVVSVNGPFQLPIPDGAYPTSYLALDWFLNIEPIKSLTLVVDNTPPVTDQTFSVPPVSINGNPFIPASTKMGLTATDAGSGVALTEFRLDAAGTAQPFQGYAANSALPLSEGAHVVEARSQDHLGFLELTKTFRVTVDATPPVTTLTIGVPKTVLPDGTVVVNPLTPFSLSAVDPVSNGVAAGVADIIFSIDSEVPRRYTGPFQIPTEGDHTVFYFSVDRVGQMESGHAFAVRVFNAPPVVSLTSPADGSVITAPATITLQADASDADGTVAQVQFFSNGPLAGIDTTAPYSVTLANQPAGNYVFTAIAIDDQGLFSLPAAVRVTVNAPPTVAITSPADNAVFTAGSDIPITANASDSDGTISQVQFFNGSNLIGQATSAPYTATIAGASAGVYTLTARATDNHGAATTSAVITVTVNANSPPTVQWIQPKDGTRFPAPASITLQADASDTDGTISLVEFFANGNKVGDVTTSPFTFQWSNVPVGTYSLTATATDNLGGTATTAPPVTITVFSVSITATGAGAAPSSHPTGGGVLAQSGPVDIQVLDQNYNTVRRVVVDGSAGQEIASLWTPEKSKGLAPGAYFLVIRSGDSTTHRTVGVKP